MINRVDFIGIGPPKCATTFVAKMLAAHPGVVMPHIFSQKEIDFFTDRYGNYSRQISWYYRQFVERTDALAYGEFSPSYFSDPNSPKYIQSHLPDVKLICILRDPVKRAFSAFQQGKKACRIPASMPFAEAARSVPRVLLDSHYSVHLRRYLEFFPRQQLHVLFLDDLTQRPAETCDKLLAFLGLPKHDLSDCFDHKVNEAWLPRSYLIQNVLWSATRTARSLGLQRIVHLLRRLGPVEWVQNLNKAPGQKIRDEEYEEIAALLRSENQELCDVLNISSLPWMREQTESQAHKAA